ncbi:MAG: phosphate transport system regulatory protein PhoU [Bacteroidetes bacterium]|nr:phosphate transport system regulatory protein PhoU [Bacteroidota bacterium]
MNHFESELGVLKKDFIKMWELVSLQLKNSLSALASMDHEKAQKVMLIEMEVNDLDLKIAKSCENIIALYNPVAVDLRFVLALIKINTYLEKLGDIAAKVSKFVIKSVDPFYNDLINKTQTLAMFEEACDLVDDALIAFKNNDAKKARDIFKRDEFINEINKTAFLAIIDSIKENPANIEKYLKMINLTRRIEKAGDMSKLIAEEIIFYIEAKVIRHDSK